MPPIDEYRQQFEHEYKNRCKECEVRDYSRKDPMCNNCITRWMDKEISKMRRHPMKFKLYERDAVSRDVTPYRYIGIIEAIYNLIKKRKKIESIEITLTK